MTDDNVTPIRRRKAQDYTAKPAGANVLLLLVGALVGLVAAIESYGIRHNIQWTVSRTYWWLAGPEWSPRWAVVNLLNLGFFAWWIVHAAFPHWVGGRELFVTLAVVAVVASLVLLPRLI